MHTLPHTSPLPLAVVGLYVEIRRKRRGEGRVEEGERRGGRRGEEGLGGVGWSGRRGGVAWRRKMGGMRYARRGGGYEEEWDGYETQWG